MFTVSQESIEARWEMDPGRAAVHPPWAPPNTTISCLVLPSIEHIVWPCRPAGFVSPTGSNSTQDMVDQISCVCERRGSRGRLLFFFFTRQASNKGGTGVPKKE